MMYWRELTVAWGESDPFGLVYFPRMLAWFNDTEHELFRTLGYPIDKMIKDDRTTFVMGEINFRFIGPAAYGDKVTLWIEMEDLRAKTLHWVCRARLSSTRAPVMEGRATRVYAHIKDDGSLSSAVIPDDMRKALTSPDVGLDNSVSDVEAT
jgi:4-hydroxybenzoyl-CoA thioesterase